MEPNTVPVTNEKSQVGWHRIPAGLRERPQWVLAGADKSPLTVNGGRASSTDPSTWASFDAVCAAAKPGQFIGYVLSVDDPFTCIDLDVKDETALQVIEGYKNAITNFDSYTEHSRSGRGYHIWLQGKIGTGRRRHGVEVYSQERFIICTGNVVLDRPISARPSHLALLLQSLSPAPTDIELPPDDSSGVPGYAVAHEAFHDEGELGQLFRTGA